MPGSVAGAAGSGTPGGGFAWSSPGSRKVAGDTLCVALMPLQPAPNKIIAGMQSIRNTFLFNLTESEYKLLYDQRKD